MEADTESNPSTEGQEKADGLFVLFLILLVLFFIWVITRRTSSTQNLPDKCEDIWLYGRVTGLADGDGFWFFDCPWLRSRSYTREDDKLYVRLAGIDAPEMGGPNTDPEFLAEESKAYLGSLIRGRNIKIKIVGVDQYNRVLAFAYLPRWFIEPLFKQWFPISLFDWLLFVLNFSGLVPIKLFECFFEKCFGGLPISICEWLQNDFFYTNVNLKMVENGYAYVYDGRNAMYDKYKEDLISLEEKAERAEKNVWRPDNPETPMSYKRRHRQ